MRRRGAGTSAAPILALFGLIDQRVPVSRRLPPSRGDLLRVRDRTLAGLAPVQPLIFPVLVVVTGCAAATAGDQERIGSWGLVQALPGLYFISLAVLTVSFFMEMFGRGGRERQVVLAVHLVGLVVLLHGVAGFLEQEPRFPTAWLHAGYTEQILERHFAPGSVDARFTWPGFFGAAATVTGAAGLDSAVPLLRWAPIFMVLLYLPPLFVIGRQLTGSVTATWLGLWMFLLVNWVGQDYFAPQTLGFTLYLTAVAMLVAFFRQPSPGPGPLEQTPRWSWLTRGDLLAFDGRPDVETAPRTRVALIILLMVIAAGLAMTHQLSPIVLVLACGGLVLVGRCRLTVLPVIAGVFTLAWISVGTTDYWLGHLDTIFGGVGNVQEVLSNSVGERVEGSTIHLVVVRLRLALTASVWAMMVAAALLLWLRRRPPLTLFTLGIVPFATLAQNYGDEGVMRIFLFSSPFACLLVGQAVTSLLHLPRVRPAVLVAALTLLPLFLVTRYGNESFEQVRPDEIDAIHALYRLAPRGADLVSPTSQVPWRFTHATDYDYGRPEYADAFLTGRRPAVRWLLGGSAENASGAYLVVTRSQQIYAYEALGQPRDWFEEVRRKLHSKNGYRLLFRNQDASIYEYEVPR